MNEQPKLYKVLIDGKSYNGGEFTYPLPRKRGRGWQAGEWTPAVDGVSCCSTGYHLTTKPFEWFKWGATIYEAEGAGTFHTDGSDKTAFQQARLLRPVPEPEWMARTKTLIDGIKNVNWLTPDGKPDPKWKVFVTRAAAGAAARDAARDAAWDAAWAAAWAAAWDAAGGAARDAARDAAGTAAGDAAWAAARTAAGDAAWAARLNIWVDGICSDLPLDEKHRAHSRARWEVWQKGYGLLCDVNGELYVYKKLI